jgi:hypothetical protein
LIQSRSKTLGHGYESVPGRRFQGDVMRGLIGTTRGVCIAAAGAVLLLASTALGQLSGATVDTTGSTCTGAGSPEGDCNGSADFIVNTATQLSTQFAWNVNANADAGGEYDTSGTAQHNIAFTATAPGAYKLTIQTQRVGDLNRIADDPSCQGSVDVSSVSGSSNVALTTGTLNLADPGSIPDGTTTTELPFNQLGAATIVRVSNGVPQTHTLTFSWSGSAVSNSCEAAVRMGESSGSTLNCPGCEYPGSPSRAQGGDGHFVTVIFTSFCGNGTVDAGVGEQCDQGALNGTPGSCCTATCQFRSSGEVCRNSAGVCDPQETCSGTAATCPADAKSTAVCRSSGGVCDVAESCDGVNDDCPADAKSTALCRASAGFCDVAESCDGVNNDCPTDVFEPATVTCRAAAGVCDVAESCTGTGAACPSDAKSTAVCRPSAGVCDVAESCDGIGNDCPTDAVKASGTVCRSGSGDLCDPDETCDGVATTCPADFVAAAGTVCRSGSGDLCDPDEVCSGNAGEACPPDAFASAFTVCRTGSGDLCDPDEHCPGAAGQPCPSDTVAAAGTVCRPGSGDVCDPDETCTGQATEPCPADTVEPASTVCRPGSGDICDPDEYCPGVPTGTCAADVMAPPTTVCRVGSGDLCDPDEFCPGVPAGSCAADVVAPAGTVCNPGSGDMCDPDETCSGTAGEPCPADTVAPNTTVCRAAAGVCDVPDYCPGTPDAPCSADAKQPTSEVCRASVGACDAAETCDGVGNDCPADAAQPDGHSCSDGLFCNGAETCQSGACTAGNPPCAFADICSESSSSCLTTACPDDPQTGCRSAAKSLLLIKSKTDNSKDRLVWKWIKGAQTTATEFADPTATSEYAFCVYAGSTNALVATVHIPPGTNWKPLGKVTAPKGYKYLDKSLSADGAMKVILKAGVAGKSKALLKGAGANLPDPLDAGQLGTGVTAQLLNYGSGVCWESHFAIPKKEVTNTIYKATAP